MKFAKFLGTSFFLQDTSGGHFASSFYMNTDFFHKSIRLLERHKIIFTAIYFFSMLVFIHK